MKELVKISTIILLSFSLIQCDHIQDKSEKVAERVKAKVNSEIKQHTKRVGDKVFPPFDYEEADTENNKRRFEDFLKVEISRDIKNIYCFDDAIGIDKDYMFSFNCNYLTSQKIIEVHNLTVDTLNTDNAFGLQHDFEWWDKERIKKLKKYSWKGEHQYHKFYWYDKENEKAYYFDFDL